MPSSREPGNDANRLVVISGPSGAGKTSICERLLERLPNAVWSVSATTRPIRGHEVEGEEYFFVTRSEFETMRDRGDFLEWASYLGNLYGTPTEPVRKSVAEGKTVVLEIDVQGAIQVARKMPDSLRLFIMPPSKTALESRLKGRKTENRQELEQRLAEADMEIAKARESGVYDFYVINNNLKEAVDRVTNIIEKGSQTA